MIEFFPRHYRVDERGRHVLIGLSAAETLESEKLEELPPLDDSGRIAWTDEGAAKNVGLNFTSSTRLHGPAGRRRRSSSPASL